MASNIDDQKIAGTNVKKNPELPAPTKVVARGPKDTDSGVIEAPIFNTETPLPPPVLGSPISRDRPLHIEVVKAVNGYVLDLSYGIEYKKWIFSDFDSMLNSMNRLIEKIYEESYSDVEDTEDGE